MPKSLLTTAGASVSIKCCAEGGPDNIFHWNHNGEVLANETAKFLNVSAMTAGDLGNYTCMVTNRAGSGSSSSTIHGKFPACKQHVHAWQTAFTIIGT